MRVFITNLLAKQLKNSPQQNTPNVSLQALQKLYAAVSLVHTLFLLNSVQISNRVEGKLFSP